MQEPEAGRRIVSKGAYAGVLAVRTGFAVSGFCAVVAGMVFCFLTVVCLCLLVKNLNFNPLMPWCVYLVGAVGCGKATEKAFLLGDTHLRKASENNVVPLTRANTADLPAPDSLVRASQEPMQARVDGMCQGF